MSVTGAVPSISRIHTRYIYNNEAVLISSATFTTPLFYRPPCLVYPQGLYNSMCGTAITLETDESTTMRKYLRDFDQRVISIWFPQCSDLSTNINYLHSLTMIPMCPREFNSRGSMLYSFCRFPGWPRWTHTISST